MYTFLVRWFQQWLNELSRKLTKRTSLERNKRTDVRDIRRHLPVIGREYDPSKYMEADPKKGNGIFLGLDEHNFPIHLSYEIWRKSHVQIIGTTDSGKGVASALMLSQALRAGEAVFVLDPKDDEWGSHVLAAESQRAGVPFHLIDLRQDLPQLDLLAAVSAKQLEELVIIPEDPQEVTEAMCLWVQYLPKMKEDIMTIAQQLRQQGMQEGKYEVAKNLFAAGIDPKVIKQSTGLTDEELKKLH